MIKILASDGMEKSAVAALEAKGCQVDQQFYDPEALKEAVKNYGGQGSGQAEAGHPRRRGRGQHRREVRRSERHHRPQHSPRQLPVRGGARHGPHVRLCPVPVHRRSHHAGGQVGEEGIRQGHRAPGQDPGHHRLWPHRPAPGRHGQGHRHEGRGLRYLPSMPPRWTAAPSSTPTPSPR